MQTGVPFDVTPELKHQRVFAMLMKDQVCYAPCEKHTTQHPGQLMVAYASYH
jgi:hypothetical protein